MTQSTTNTQQIPGCHEALELLPWLLNGTLEADERRELLAHLADCSSCRDELAEMRQAAELLTQHVPSLALVEYAQGLAPSELDREQIEQHLVQCSACRQEADWVLADQVVDFQAARERLATKAASDSASVANSPDSEQEDSKHRRHWAIAATVTLALGAGALLVSENESSHEPAKGPAVAALQAGEAAAPNPASVFSDGFELGSTARWSSSNNESR